MVSRMSPTLRRGVEAWSSILYFAQYIDVLLAFRFSALWAELVIKSPCLSPSVKLPHGDCFTGSALLCFNTFEFNKFLLNTTWFNKHLFNISCIQHTLHSTNLVFNTIWLQQSLIQQSLFSTHLGFNNYCLKQILFLGLFYLLFFRKLKSWHIISPISTFIIHSIWVWQNYFLESLSAFVCCLWAPESGWGGRGAELNSRDDDRPGAVHAKAEFAADSLDQHRLVTL